MGVVHAVVPWCSRVGGTVDTMCIGVGLTIASAASPCTRLTLPSVVRCLDPSLLQCAACDRAPDTLLLLVCCLPAAVRCL
jgi:hypothetical protein